MDETRPLLFKRKTNSSVCILFICVIISLIILMLYGMFNQRNDAHDSTIPLNTWSNDNKKSLIVFIKNGTLVNECLKKYINKNIEIIYSSRDIILNNEDMNNISIKSMFPHTPIFKYEDYTFFSEIHSCLILSEKDMNTFFINKEIKWNKNTDVFIMFQYFQFYSTYIFGQICNY